MPVPGITKTGVIDVETYQRCKNIILANSTALQVLEDDQLVGGLNDEQLAAQLGLTLWEVREIRAIAKRDAVSLADWRKADERMQLNHELFVMGRGSRRRSPGNSENS